MQVVEPVVNSAQVVAIVGGQPITDLPHDLFIPPDALEVMLDSFTGPLDLLLYLIRRQNIDIMDIPVLVITRQYMQYIELMEKCRMELAADYLVMAAMLAEIKSRLLLPREPTPGIETEEDPRMELVRRLQEYEQFKYAASMLDTLTRCERDVFPVHTHLSNISLIRPHPDVDLKSIVSAMESLLVTQGRQVSHSIQREILSVRVRMGEVLSRLQHEHYLDFSRLYFVQEGRMGLVVSLLAILELAKQSLLVITQTALYAPIYVSNIVDKQAEFSKETN